VSVVHGHDLLDLLLRLVEDDTARGIYHAVTTRQTAGVLAALIADAARVDRVEPWDQCPETCGRDWSLVVAANVCSQKVKARSPGHFSPPGGGKPCIRTTVQGSDPGFESRGVRVCAGHRPLTCGDARARRDSNPQPSDPYRSMDQTASSP